MLVVQNVTLSDEEKNFRKLRFNLLKKECLCFLIAALVGISACGVIVSIYKSVTSYQFDLVAWLITYAFCEIVRRLIMLLVPIVQQTSEVIDNVKYVRSHLLSSDNRYYKA